MSSPRGAPRDARVAGTPLRGPIITGLWNMGSRLRGNDGNGFCGNDTIARCANHLESRANGRDAGYGLDEGAAEPRGTLLLREAACPLAISLIPNKVPARIA
jgi:hypothetical protein